MSSFYGIEYIVVKTKYLVQICILESFLSDSEDEYEADEEDAQEVGYASEPAVGLSDVSMLFCYTWYQKYTIDVSDHNICFLRGLVIEQYSVCVEQT